MWMVVMGRGIGRPVILRVRVDFQSNLTVNHDVTVHGNASKIDRDTCVVTL